VRSDLGYLLKLNPKLISAELMLILLNPLGPTFTRQCKGDVMAVINKVQFQAGMRLSLFSRRYGMRLAEAQRQSPFRILNLDRGGH
jgi:hypothetical protein